MKKTSKLLLLLASLGMLIGCGPKGGTDPQPSEDPNQINVIYFKSYVSPERATAIKNAYVAGLQTAGVEVDATKVNFFESTNSKVDGLVDEILRYNTKHPNNNVDVILGANGFSKVSDPDQKAKFDAIYVNDGTNYTYGTSTKAEDNTNRKFWYNKDKLTNQYVAGLQTYLKANWTAVPEPVKTNKLVVMTYGTFVSETRMNAIETAFDSYLSTQSKSISTVEFVHESETATIADFMGKVTEYDSNHSDAKVDVLIGLNADKDSAISSQGFQKDSTNYNYGDRASTAEKDYTQDNKERKLWFKPVDGSITVEEKLFQDYLLANWKTPEADYFLVGDMNEWSTASTAYPLTKITDGEYKYENLEVTAGAAFKVYYPAGATDADKWFTNASTWDGCGFTLSNPDKNIVVTEAGKYTVNFFVTGENNNHITLEKPVANAFKIGIYNKYVTTNAQALKDGITAAFTTAGLEKTPVFTSLGTENVGPTAYNSVKDEIVLLGFNGDGNYTPEGGEAINNVLASKGFEKYNDDNYLYGTDTNRKLWVLSTEKESTEVTTLYNYLQANWRPVNRDLYLVGTMNDWDTTNTEYKLTKVDENTYSYASLQVTDSASFKVYYPAGATTNDKWFTNASTWDDCGFTLSEPDKNVVLTGTGKYNITFYWTAQGNNHITIEKQSENNVYICLYKKFIASANLQTIKDGIIAAFTSAGITKTPVFQEAGNSSTTIAQLVPLLAPGTSVIIGPNGDSEIKDSNPKAYYLASAGFEQYSNHKYTYGPAGDNQNNRKLWVLTAAKSNPETVAVYNYLEANWKAAA